MGSLLAWILAALSAPLPPSVADRPRSLEYCYQHQFALAPGPYLHAVPAAGATPARIDAEDRCVAGDLAGCRRIPLEPSAAWVAGARAGDWICVTSGAVSGWVPLAELSLAPMPALAAAEWIGEWERDAGLATIAIRSEERGALAVTGEAEWMAGPDATPHLGDLGDSGTPAGVVLVLGDPRCVGPDRAEKSDTLEACLACCARLVLVNGTLIVTDNRYCGGMNVNFDGMYHRHRP